MAEMVRATVEFRGTVQGVGFRYTAMQAASGFAVTGYVRNEADGSVTMVAEGERAEIEALIAAVHGRMRGYVRDTRVAWSAATDEFDDFGVSFSW